MTTPGREQRILSNSLVTRPSIVRRASGRSVKQRCYDNRDSPKEAVPRSWPAGWAFPG